MATLSTPQEVTFTPTHRKMGFCAGSVDEFLDALTDSGLTARIYLLKQAEFPAVRRQHGYAMKEVSSYLDALQAHYEGLAAAGKVLATDGKD